MNPDKMMTKKSNVDCRVSPASNAFDNVENLPDSKDQKYIAKVFFICSVATLAQFNMGYNTGVPNNPERVIRDCPTPNNNTGGLPDCLPMSDLIWGFSIGIFCIGGLLGGLSAGPIADKLGRNRTLFWNNINFIIGGMFMACSVNVPMFTIGRFFVGLGSGAGSVIVPMYIAEVSTTRNRGAMGSMVQMQLAIGIVISQGISLGLSSIPWWRLLLGLTIIPAIIQMVLLCYSPETPRYLLTKNRFDEAKESLQKLRPGCYVENEYSEMVKSIGGDAHEANSNSPGEGHLLKRIKDVVSHPFLRKMVLVGLIIHASQTLSSVNGVTLYSTSIMTKTTGLKVAQLITVGIAILNFFINCVTCVVIDRTGRRPLLLTSIMLMVIFSATLVIGQKLSISILEICSVICFSASFNIGLASIPFLIIPEMVPTWAAGVVVSMTTSANWIGNFLVVFLFPTVMSKIGDNTFILVTALNFLFFVHHFFFVPETKGRDINDIMSEMDAYNASKANISS
ncbi:Bifunctional purine biosynthesis protein PurH [Basidiobolus ranarum]|uniref:Bifunctional purine biosynthesis protein PurH n=1 Tax=Basidiobolus ranarum TaxID=34480 RepID=A0ABR2WU34_9FUNG